MWQNRTARTAAKAAGGACMGLTFTAGAQGLYLNSLYKPLPEARGPMTGVFCAASILRLRRTALGCDKYAEAAEPQVQVQAQARAQQPQAPAQAQAPLPPPLQPPPPGPQLPPAGKRKILFIGDSLVTGVGCSPEGALGPALPRSVAECVSRLLRQDVEWTDSLESGPSAVTSQCCNLSSAVTSPVL